LEPSRRLLQLLEPVAATLDVEDVGVVEQPVQDRGGHHLVAGQDRRPVPDALVGRDRDAPAAAAGGDQTEERLAWCRLMDSNPTLTVSALAPLLKERFEVEVHPRSIERALARVKKPVERPAAPAVLVTSERLLVG
jgi:hypothetical protein